ncbi:MAG TPA: OmpA family protein [Alphaproteobacteria bacterium]
MTAAAAAAILALAPVMAKAETSPLYLSFGAGYSMLEDSDFSGAGVSTDANYNNGWGLLGAVGIGLFNNVRAEAELGYRHNTIDNLNGDMSATSLMANFLYDIPTGWGFTPYIGLGIGGAQISANHVNPLGTNGTADDDDTQLAYQGIIGVSAPIDYNWTFTADYRYLSTFDDASFSTSAGTSVDSQYKDHMITIGFRYSFGTPPAAPVATPVAAPAPAPAPAPAAPAPALVRSFQVFFDFDKSDITADARRVIEQAAANTKQAGTTRVTLTGHTDSSGSAQYNQRLSQRRADAVKAEMVRMGVPANDIVTVAKGESDQLVPTADGVREPRNRRVEIVF